jgi:hypothetical protein
MHEVRSNVCRWKYHGENTHRGDPITTKIKRGVAMQRDWEEHISGSVEKETRVEVLAAISRKEAPEVKKQGKKTLKGQPTMKEDQSKTSKFASSKRYNGEVW